MFSVPLTGTPNEDCAVNEAIGKAKHDNMTHAAKNKNIDCFLCIISFFSVSIYYVLSLLFKLHVGNIVYSFIMPFAQHAAIFQQDTSGVRPQHCLDGGRIGKIVLHVFHLILMQELL